MPMVMKLVEPHAQFEDGSSPSNKERIDASIPKSAADEPMSKKQRRQIRNRDAAVRSRMRKKMHVKNLKIKSRYYEGECRGLGHLLRCCYAKNRAWLLCLQTHGASGASMTKLELAMLLLDVGFPAVE